VPEIAPGQMYVRVTATLEGATGSRTVLSLEMHGNPSDDVFLSDVARSLRMVLAALETEKTTESFSGPSPGQ